MDVSVVLNCHDEFNYLKNTLTSLDLAITEAIKKGISVELVVVFDNSDDQLVQILKDHKFSTEYKTRIVRTNNRSLGKSRNDGVRCAAGKYISIADADDLVSVNSIVNPYNLAEEYDLKGKDVAIYPQYVFIFGLDNFIYTMFNSDIYSAADFAYWNPFNSKLFIKRKLLLERPYQDLGVTSGFAFEDWEYNTYLYDRKIPQVVANDVILYYRQRHNSIMRKSDYIRVTPDNHLFEPLNFLTRESDYSFDKNEKRRLLTSDISLNVKRNANLIRDININSMIEPEINVQTLNKSISCLSSISSNHWAKELGLFFRLTGCNKYQYVYILSSLEKTKVILDTFNKNKLTESNYLIISLRKDKDLVELTALENINVIFFNDFFDWMLQTNKENLILRFLFSVHNQHSFLFIDNGNLEKTLVQKYLKSLEKYYQVLPIKSDFSFDKEKSPQYRSNHEARKTIIYEYQTLTGDQQENKLQFLMLHVIPRKGRDSTWDRLIADKLRSYPWLFSLIKKIYHKPFVYTFIQKLKNKGY